MKRIVPLVLFAFCIVFASDAIAQKRYKKSGKDKKEAKKNKKGKKNASSPSLSKKELKEWKKRIKNLEPVQYKALLDENKLLKGQVSSLKYELDNVDNKVTAKDNEVTSYQSQISDLKKELVRVRNQKPPKNVPSNNNVEENRGIVFKVQIGAYRQKDLSQYDNSKNFSAESAGGLQKYTIGVFRDYWEADTFKKYLREMGVKDAWVVSYRDGNRVPIREVLERTSKKS